MDSKMIDCAATVTDRGTDPLILLIDNLSLL